MTKHRLFYIIGLLVIGCVAVNAQATAEQQDQIYQYLKGIIDNMNDPMLDKKNAPVGKKGDTWRNDGDLPYFYTYPNGKNEPGEYVERNADGTPKSYTWWGVGRKLNSWLFDCYNWMSFPFAVNSTAFRDAHGTKARPQGKATISVTSDRIVFTTYYDWQIAPEGTGKRGGVGKIGDPFTKHLGCKQGGTSTTRAHFSLNLLGETFQVDGKIVCNRHYIKFVDIGLSQTRQSNGTYRVQRSYGDADNLDAASFQSCWFVAHWQTTTFMLDDVARACNMTRQELEMLILRGGFKSFYLAGEALPLNYLLAYPLMKKHGLDMKKMVAQHEVYQKELAEQKHKREEQLRAAAEAKRRREAFVSDSLAEEAVYYEALFKAFPKIKKPYLAWKQKAETKLAEESQKVDAEMKPRLEQLAIKYKGDLENEDYKRAQTKFLEEYRSKYEAIAKDVEAFVEPEKAKYQKASAKYKDDIKAFCEKYIREHPKFRQPMNQY